MREAAEASSTVSKPAVALRDVTIAFRLAGGTSYTAVQHASLTVGEGEFGVDDDAVVIDGCRNDHRIVLRVGCGFVLRPNETAEQE